LALPWNNLPIICAPNGRLIAFSMIVEIDRCNLCVDKEQRLVG
jgi:hypothetical protein